MGGCCSSIEEELRSLRIQKGIVTGSAVSTNQYEKKYINQAGQNSALVGTNMLQTGNPQEYNQSFQMSTPLSTVPVVAASNNISAVGLADEMGQPLLQNGAVPYPNLLSTSPVQASEQIFREEQFRLVSPAADPKVDIFGNTAVSAPLTSLDEVKRSQSPNLAPNAEKLVESATFSVPNFPAGSNQTPNASPLVQATIGGVNATSIDNQASIGINQAPDQALIANASKDIPLEKFLAEPYPPSFQATPDPAAVNIAQQAINTGGQASPSPALLAQDGQAPKDIQNVMQTAFNIQKNPGKIKADVTYDGYANSIAQNFENFSKVTGDAPIQKYGDLYAGSKASVATPYKLVSTMTMERNSENVYNGQSLNAPRLPGASEQNFALSSGTDFFQGVDRNGKITTVRNVESIKGVSITNIPAGVQNFFDKEAPSVRVTDPSAFNAQIDLKSNPLSAQPAPLSPNIKAVSTTPTVESFLVSAPVAAVKTETVPSEVKAAAAPAVAVTQQIPEQLLREDLNKPQGGFIATWADKIKSAYNEAQSVDVNAPRTSGQTVPVKSNFNINMF